MDTLKNNGLDSEPHPLHENLMENGKTINYLPVEMLGEIFGYLTHTQKLISRLVCTQWNHQISSILSNNSYFQLKSTESHQVFLDSEIEWTKIKLLNHGFQIPEKKRSVIKAFQTDVSMLEELRLVLIQFPNVISLELNAIENKKLVYSSLKNGRCGEQFRTILTKLKILSIKSTMTNYKSFYGIIKDFAGAAETMILNDLKLHINELMDDVDDDIDIENEPALFSEIYTIILKSSRTLHSMILDFESVSLFPELISKLCDLDELKLKSVWLNIQWEWMEEKGTEKAELEFLIYKKFFKTHKTAVRSIHLPSSLDEPSCQELIHSISKSSIEVVKDVNNGRRVSELLSTFTKLRTIEIFSDDIPLFSHECPSLRECHISSLTDMEDIYTGTMERVDWTDKVVAFYKSLDTSFINLVELHVGDIGHEAEGFYDWNLQLIIYNMPKLKSLHFERGFRISDYGVTGIDLKYSEDLLETNKLHLHQCIPEEKVNGRPLSSLTMLEKLVIHEDSMSRITDFGIYYGLLFGPTMQHLSIGSYYGNISDWGLYWLGAGNPSLESFSGTFKSKKIVDGAELMREQLELVKSTQKFKLVNVAPET